MKRGSIFILSWLVLVMFSVALLPVPTASAASGVVDPPQGAPGTTFTFTAEGFIPQERVDAWVTRPDATPVTPSIGRYRADDAGRVSWSWTAPGDSQNGTWVMAAIGVDSDIKVDIPFLIEGVPYEIVIPQSVAPLSGPPGTTFTFTAGGFTAGERVGPWIVRPDGSTLSLPNEDQAVNLYADPAGFASWSWTAPEDVPVGNWSSQARGANSGLLVDIPFQITGPEAVPPVQTMSPASGPPGTVFTFTAGGFIPGEQAGSWLNPPGGGQLDATGYIIADAETGIITWTWESPPDAGGGIWRMIALGETSRREVIFTFEVTGPPAPPPLPELYTVTPSHGLPGTTFAFWAEGFQPFESIHYWVIDPQGKPEPNAKTEEASGAGVAEWSWATPVDAQPGQWIMSVRGGVTRTEYQIPFTIDRPDYLPPETGVEPSTGGPGTEFKFAATGYNGSEFIDWWAEGPENSFIPGTIRDIKSNSDGYLEWRWRAPDDIVAGNWRMNARGRDSMHLQVINFTIVRDTPPPPPPAYGVTPASGPPGTTFKFFAEGFKGDEVVGYWLSDPDDNVVRVDLEVIASPSGVINWEWTAPADARRGEWRMIARSTGLIYRSTPSENDVMYVIPFTIE